MGIFFYYTFSINTSEKERKNKLETIIFYFLFSLSVIMETTKKTLLEAVQSAWPGSSMSEGEPIRRGNPWEDGSSFLGQELTFRIVGSNKITHLVRVQVEEGGDPPCFVKFSVDWFDSRPFDVEDFVSELQTFFKIT